MDDRQVLPIRVLRAVPVGTSLGSGPMGTWRENIQVRK